MVWATNTVVHLLENREYTGCLVNFKTEKPSYKMKHSIDNPIEKQMCIRDRVQSQYGIVGLAVRNGGNHVKTDKDVYKRQH